MGILAPLLALTALWGGPELTHNTSWVGSNAQNQCSAIDTSGMRATRLSLSITHTRGYLCL